MFCLLKTLFAAFLAGIWLPVAAQTLRPSLAEPFRMPERFAGYNGRSTEGPSWGDGAFRNFVAGQAPDWVRYPGGTVANYWDWSTGTFLEGSGKRSDYPYPIALFAAGLPTDARIVYVVNMVRERPGAKGSITDDILAALAEFERCGHLPQAVELGNELYFKNEHAGTYPADCPRYLTDARQIACSIQAKYPQIKLLLCTTKAGTPGRDAWNRRISTALAADSILRHAVHGVVQHHYINDSYGDPTPISDALSATKAIAEGVRYPAEVFADGSYDAVPDGLEVWITEYGATKRNATGTWAAGLRAVAMTLSWLDWHQKLGCLLWHHITATPDVLERDGQTPGPVGTAYGLFMQAAKGMTCWQRITFPDGPTRSDGTPLFFGYKASDGVCERLLLLNIGDQTATADLSVLCTCDPVRIRQINTEIPYLPHSALHTTESSDLKSFRFAPFSLTLIQTTKQP